MNNARHDHLDEFGITKIYKDSTRSDAPQAFVMGIGDWKQRIEQWDKDNHGRTIGKFEGSGLDIVFTSLADDKQRMNVYSDPLKPKVHEEVKSLIEPNLFKDQTMMVIREVGGWLKRTIGEIMK